jgi:SAM-dependent methyltransferase
MEITAHTPYDIPSAYSKYYSRLADEFIRLIKPLHPSTVLEAGVGQGQLTLPLLGRLPAKTKVIGVDSSRGAYAGWVDELAFNANEAGFRKRIHLIKADARSIRSMKQASVDVIVSNELICDLPQERQLIRAFQEFHRLLRPGGKMIHGEWTSQAEDRIQGLTIKHWPTWNPDQVFSQLEKVGFCDIRATYFDTTISFGYQAALNELLTWGTSPNMIRKNSRTIKNNGIRLPFEHIIDCSR